MLMLLIWEYKIFARFDVTWANWSLDLITIGSVIYGYAFFLSWSEQTWQTSNLLVQITIYGEYSYLGHIFQYVD